MQTYPLIRSEQGIYQSRMLKISIKLSVKPLTDQYFSTITEPGMEVNCEAHRVGGSPLAVGWPTVGPDPASHVDAAGARAAANC